MGFGDACCFWRRKKLLQCLKILYVKEVDKTVCPKAFGIPSRPGNLDRISINKMNPVGMVY
jgi:hypothetical protein